MYQYSLVDFSCKAYCKVDFGHTKILEAIFSGQSLLLSTTVLNDIYIYIYIFVHVATSYLSSRTRLLGWHLLIEDYKPLTISLVF